jgi:AcrR family transcriptional regulator
MYEFSDNKKASKSQKKIYKALRKILLRKPLSKITVADINNECGISRSTFYRNFNNVTDVLTVIFGWFYNNYFQLRLQKTNKVLFFFEYWYWHRDLIQILAEQNIGIIESCMIRHDQELKTNPYLLALKLSMSTSLLVAWAQSKRETPQEMERIAKQLLRKRCLDVLFA